MKSHLTKKGYLHDAQTNVWSRPEYQGIPYSDGDEVEQRIATIIEHAADLGVLSFELRQHCTDWASLYHLTSARANILRPFESVLHGDVLEIGAGCGAVTRYLGECGASVLALEGSPRRAAIARSRTRDLPNITVVSDKFEQFESDRQFDVITLIGVLEYANLYTPGTSPALAMLERVRSMLKANGKLIVAIENQMGLKYFAGAPEDHLGKPMYGIEGRYQRGQPQTFGREVLLRLLKDAGLVASEVLSPFPDYKLPVSILTERGIAHPEFDAATLALQSVIRDPQLPAAMSFSLELAWPEIFKNGLAADLANSFLIIAAQSPAQRPLTEQGILGYHYSTERAPAFCKETRFFENASGEVAVSYKCLAGTRQPQAQSADYSMCVDDTASYFQGRPLSREFLEVINQPLWSLSDMTCFINRYLDAVKTISLGKGVAFERPLTEICLPPEFFDLLPQNIIVNNDGGFHAYDLEWKFFPGISLDFLVFRALFVGLGGVQSCSLPHEGTPLDWKSLIQDVSESCGLPIPDQKYVDYLSREIEFRKMATGLPSGTIDILLTYRLPISSVNIEQENALEQRDRVVAERRCAVAERRYANAVAERDNALPERRDAVMERRSAVSEWHGAVAERDRAWMERDQAIRERSGMLAERDKALTERDNAAALANLMKQSASWKLTGPLRFIARLARYGLTSENRHLLSQKLRQRYHRFPLPAPAKRLASFTYHKVLNKSLSAVRRRVLRDSPFQGPALNSPSVLGAFPDYIVWGVIDWHFRHQRPQQLAVALANTGRRVYYISPNFTDDPREGFEVEALDAAGLIFQIKLFVKNAPVIYSSSPSLEAVAQLRASIGEMLHWASARQLVSLVQHPFWYDVAAVLPNSSLVYDCMDHHEGFGNNAESLLQLERSLLKHADLTITTSTWLDEAVAPHVRRQALIRNAGDYLHFSTVPANVYHDRLGRRIIGYYGAIAEWFDLDLIEAVAKAHPECCVLLIGADTVNARGRLAMLPNVTFTGEVPYSALPYYLHGFDVCLLPFKVIPLTLATNPVKAYEYLSATKPVVAVDLPEMTQFAGLVYVASDKDSFVAEVRSVLANLEPDTLLQQRQAFAQCQTWRQRADTLIEFVESFENDPKVSVVVVTYNNLDFTRACLASLDQYSQYENSEVIVVDNASSDCSPAFLSEWVAGKGNRKLILNEDNRGFAAANNQGLALASGEYLVMLNNDTYVTPGWIRTLLRHLDRDKTIGLIGPVTNNIGNEARIDVNYSNMEEMLKQSGTYTWRHIGQTYPLRTAAFFCVMMPRTTYERVGPLDEAFGRGFFEDDDYCRRIEQTGARIVCAEDVFIHHHLSASFDKLKQQDRQKLFEDNKRIYEDKWGKWMPHSYRETA